jgi:hypothetical protein
MPHKANEDYKERFGRLCVLYGVSSDPGVEVVIAHRSETISSFIPTAMEREIGLGWWNARKAPLAELLLFITRTALFDSL